MGCASPNSERFHSASQSFEIATTRFQWSKPLTFKVETPPIVHSANAAAFRFAILRKGQLNRLTQRYRPATTTRETFVLRKGQL